MGFCCCCKGNADDEDFDDPSERSSGGGRVGSPSVNNLPLPHHDRERFNFIKKVLKPLYEETSDLAALCDALEQLDASPNSISGITRFFNDFMQEDENTTFFEETLPFIARLALDLPNLMLFPLPYLRAQHQRTITLSRIQVASLLANAFFGVIPPPIHSMQCNDLNFGRLYTTMAQGNDNIHQKFRCIVHYFTRLSVSMPQGHVVFKRRCIEPPTWVYWGGSTEPLTDLEFLEDGLIEDAGSRALLADFANRNIGGGILSRGCVQEEIMFSVCPELICSLLFTEQMHDNEVVFITGTDRFCEYKGYGSDFEFVGDHVDPDTGQKTIVAMDALMFHGGIREQLSDHNLLREINKAHAAFVPGKDDRPIPIATGNWGCGAFGGDPEIKALVQLIAASKSKRSLWYYTFGDSRISWFRTTHKLLKTYDVNVGMLVEKLLQLAKNPPSEESFSVFEWISNNLLDDIDKVRAKVEKRHEKIKAKGESSNVGFIP